MKKILIILIALISSNLYSQDDLLEMLDSSNTDAIQEVSATFKASRIISAHSIESMKEGQLNFRISHRFGAVNSGIDELFGIDQSTIFLALEYGITDWFEIGLGRASLEKTINGFAKFRVLTQKENNGSPLSLSFLTSADIKTTKWDKDGYEDFIPNRMSFTNQLMIARKFNEDFSLQLSPTFIHFNLVPTALDQNNVFAMGIGGRYKFTKRFSVNFEYFYVLRPTWNVEYEYRNPISIGFDLETGGHVFQIMLTNSPGMIEKQYIFENTGDWSKNDIHLGFNITRPFAIFE